MTTPTILDCDPGHDDVLAMLLAYASPAIDLRAITTVAGNQTLDKVTDNARRITTLAGIDDVPVAAGADRPLVGPLVVADDVHGRSGLDGADLPEPQTPLYDGDAASLMTDVLEASSDSVTLIATGPLTNVARLLRDHPDSAGDVAQIVWMGGSTAHGNVEPYAEFNAYVDPEAAVEVFGSGLPVTMIGLNVTHQALATDAVRTRIRRCGAPVGTTIADLLEFFGGTYQRIWDLDGPPVHDAVAVARAIDPTFVDCERTSVVVETQGEYTRGATVVDLYDRAGRSPNAYVGTGLDTARFWDLLIGAIAAY